MKKKKNFYSFILVLILLVIVGFFAVKMDIFKENSIEILTENVIYNNLKSPVSLHIKDDKKGIKNVKIVLKKDSNDTGLVLVDEKIKDKKDLLLQVELPKAAYKEKLKSYILELEVSNGSFLSFLGNKTQKQIVVLIDETNPKINILSRSYSIEKGGAASVVFRSTDENLDEVYIETNGSKKFKAFPYIKDGYYAALIAWDAREENFKPFVIAKDKAGNISKQPIDYLLSNRNYRTSNIALNDRFLEGKIKDLASQYSNDSDLSLLEQFKFVNETLRLANEDLIRKITSEPREEKIENFKLNLFLPLKNAAKVADFADHRFYSYKEQFVSDSYHMGLDLASVAKAPIISSNQGEVVFAGENGIYGLNLILYHGFGVYSLYGHCSSKNVDEGEFVNVSNEIANTGTSGLALGDHLHFGVLVQGVETRPEQWQDRKWIENNIYKVLDEGKKMITGGGI